MLDLPAFVSFSDASALLPKASMLQDALARGEIDAYGVRSQSPGQEPIPRHEWGSGRVMGNGGDVALLPPEAAREGSTGPFSASFAAKMGIDPDQNLPRWCNIILDGAQLAAFIDGLCEKQAAPKRAGRPASPVWETVEQDVMLELDTNGQPEPGSETAAMINKMQERYAELSGGEVPSEENTRRRLKACIKTYAELCLTGQRA